MIIFFSLVVMILLLFMSKEGFSLTSTTYSAQTIDAFTKYLKGQKSSNDDATIKTTIDTYGKAGVPESSINAYISSGKWPYTDKFKKTCLQKNISMDTLNDPEEMIIQNLSKKAGNITISSLRPFDVVCNMDASGNSIGKSMYSIKNSDYISNDDLLKKVPGFTFLNEPCNPCNILNNKYDIVVNFDGLTEYGFDTATNYFNKIINITNKFLSINHTLNSYSVCDLYKNKSDIQLITSEECDYRIDASDLKYYKELLYIDYK